MLKIFDNVLGKQVQISFENEIFLEFKVIKGDAKKVPKKCFAC